MIPHNIERLASTLFDVSISYRPTCGKCVSAQENTGRGSEETISSSRVCRFSKEHKFRKSPVRDLSIIINIHLKECQTISFYQFHLSKPTTYILLVFLFLSNNFHFPETCKKDRRNMPRQNTEMRLELECQQ